MTSGLTFYTNPMSRGRIARWMLEETGVEYETVVLDYASSMKAPDYLAINPLGKVPAIVHGDTVVTECAAICAYLADSFPSANLAPDPKARGAYYRWLFFAAGPLEAATVNRTLGVSVPDEKRGMVGYGDFETVVDTIAEAIGKSDFIAGNRFSAADVYVGSHIAWGVQFGTLPDRPQFAPYLQRLQERPAYKRAHGKDDALMPKPPSAA